MHAITICLGLQQDTMKFFFAIINKMCNINIYEFIDYSYCDISDCGERYSSRDVTKQF